MFLFCQFSIINVVFISVIHNLIPIIGFLGSVLHIIFLNFTTMQMVGWFMLFHLSYYSLSYRISLLATFIAPPVQEHNIFKVRLENKYLVVIPRSAMLKRIRTCGYLFDHICKVSYEINCTFSFSVLAVLTILMIFCSTSLYFSLYASTNLYKEMFYGFVSFFVFSICVVFIILSSTDLSLAEVEHFLLNSIYKS